MTLMTLLGAPPAKAAADTPFRKVGSFAFKLSGEVPQPEVIDPGLRIIVAPYEHGMYLMDADELKPGSRVPLEFTPGNRLVIDPVHHLLFIPELHENVQVLIPRDADGAQRVLKAPEPPRLWIYDLAQRRMAGSYTFPQAFAGLSIDATGYFAPKNLLYVITDLIELRPETALHRLVVHELDASMLLTAPVSALRWSYNLDSCSNVADGGGRYGFVHRSLRADFLSFPCDTGNQGPSNGIVRLDIPHGKDPSDTSAFTPEFEFFGGGLGDGFVAADPGSDRVAVFAGSAGAQKLYVFDAFQRAWIGSVPLPNETVAGGAFDPVTGRLYATVIGGIVQITEASWVPTPQGGEYPIDTSIAIGNPVVDPVRHRVFMTAFREINADERTQDAVLVYEDGIPPQTQATLENPDDRTQNIPEVTGVTQSTFSGGGSAYGARYLFTGGTQVKAQGQIYHVEKGVSDGFASATTAAGQGRNLPFAPGGSGREISLGRVSDVFIDSGTAAAKSISSDPDPVTRADIAQIHDDLSDSETIQHDEGDPAAASGGKDQINDGVNAARDAVTPSFQDQIAWPYPESHCADFGNDGDKSKDDGRGASVRCDHAVPSGTATATSLAEIAGLSVRVAYATSTVDAHRDPKLGMVVTARALARGVDIDGILSIGEVETIATARAFGRPGTSYSHLDRFLKEVVVRDSSGGEVYRCGFGDATCDPLVVAEKTNMQFPTHFHVAVPQPEDDPNVARTPGGAQGLVTKSIFGYWSDFNSNGEASYEVPGLQVLVYDDAYPQILELAGVAVDSHYTVTGGSVDTGDGGGGKKTIYVTNQVNYPSSTQPTIVLGNRMGPITATIERAASGIAFAMTRPREGLLFATVWLMLGTPLYLAWRRRSLASRKQESS